MGNGGTVAIVRLVCVAGVADGGACSCTRRNPCGLVLENPTRWSALLCSDGDEGEGAVVGEVRLICTVSDACNLDGRRGRLLVAAV